MQSVTWGIYCLRTSTSLTMFGAFRATNPLSGGLLWKIPWKLSKCQKRRQRERLRAVDKVVSVLNTALAREGLVLASLARWNDEMPKETEMLPKDKYTIFDRKEKKYRKAIHSKLRRERHRVRSDGWLTGLQNFPSGQEYRKESTRQASKRRRHGRRPHVERPKRRRSIRY